MLNRQCGLVQIPTRPLLNWGPLPGKPALPSRALILPLPCQAAEEPSVSFPWGAVTVAAGSEEVAWAQGLREPRERPGKAGSAVVVGVGLPGPHGLPKTMMPGSDLFQLV